MAQAAVSWSVQLAACCWRQWVMATHLEGGSCCNSMLALLGLLQLQHAGLPVVGFTACAGTLSVMKSNMGTLSTLSTAYLCSCLFREYLCVDKTGTLTTDHVTLLKHLNPQLRSSDTLLDLAYINSSMQASYTSLMQNIVGMAALLEAHPRQQVLIMCPAGQCWSMTRPAQIVQQLTGSLGCCCSLHCMATCCLLPLAPSTRTQSIRFWTKQLTISCCA